MINYKEQLENQLTPENKKILKSINSIEKSTHEWQIEFVLNDISFIQKHAFDHNSDFSLFIKNNYFYIVIDESLSFYGKARYYIDIDKEKKSFFTINTQDSFSYFFNFNNYQYMVDYDVNSVEIEIYGFEVNKQWNWIDRKRILKSVVDQIVEQTNKEKNTDFLEMINLMEDFVPINQFERTVINNLVSDLSDMTKLIEIEKL